MSIEPSLLRPMTKPDHRHEVTLGSFPGATVVQLVHGDAHRADAVVGELHSATVTVTTQKILAEDGDIAWSWLIDDLDGVVHSSDRTWTILDTPGISDFGVMLPANAVDAFRRALAEMPALRVEHQAARPHPHQSEEVIFAAPLLVLPAVVEATPHEMAHVQQIQLPSLEPAPTLPNPIVAPAPMPTTHGEAHSTLAGLEALSISAWFGDHQVLDRVTLEMPAGQVTALIGPSGCGKSTFLRILNRMHEMIPSATLAGEVRLEGHDIYEPGRKLTDARREIGMVFQKPNPFPAMSIYDNVLASLRLTGVKASTAMKDEIVESCLTKAGLWLEVRDRLRNPGGGLSGGQQQRLCIARALAIRPRVLLMDEPCSALDPTSTRRIEETIMELVDEVTIVIVTHNMQQAARVSNRCAFFLAELGTPGYIVEHGPTDAMFSTPQDQRTLDYVMGRFG